MQLSPSEIKDKLLRALDKEYNVVDMAAVVEIISILERTPITKEALESTRLGKFINELRRKTSNESLAKRAKDLVRRWRNLISKPPEPSVPTAIHTNGSNFSRYAPTCSPSIKPSPISPSLRSNPLSPHVASTLTSPALSGTYPGNRGRSVLSPPISIHSDKSSTSPILSFQQSSAVRNLATKQSTPSSNLKLNAFRSKTEHTTVNSGLHVTDSVPKTHASNKRLRKDSPPVDEPASKVSRLNGMASKAALDVFGECSRDSFGVISDRSESVVEIPPPVKVPEEEEVKVPKKRGRKKGSTKEALNAARNLAKAEDLVKNRIASIARTPKVKTTQELLAGLQAKTSGNQEIVTTSMETPPSLPNPVLIPRGTALDALEMSRNKNEHIAKFLRSQSELDTFDIDSHYADEKSNLESLKSAATVTRASAKDYDPGPELRSVSRLEQPCAADSAEAFESSTASQSGVNVIKKSNVFESVDEILSKLPELPPPDEIHWSSDSESEIVKSRGDDATVSDADVEKLQTEHWPNVNGISDDGVRNDEGDDGFREWQECVSKKSYQGELLHILPYVVID